jgi:predicted HTH transcriptional regulator
MEIVTSKFFPVVAFLGGLSVPSYRLVTVDDRDIFASSLQKEKILILAQGETLTNRLCEEQFHITRDTAARDFKLLLELGLAKKEGKGRSVRYVWVNIT